jgi:hypothetical protein
MEELLITFPKFGDYLHSTLRFVVEDNTGRALPPASRRFSLGNPSPSFFGQISRKRPEVTNRPKKAAAGSRQAGHLEVYVEQSVLSIQRSWANNLPVLTPKLGRQIVFCPTRDIVISDDPTRQYLEIDFQPLLLRWTFTLSCCLHHRMASHTQCKATLWESESVACARVRELLSHTAVQQNMRLLFPCRQNIIHAPRERCKERA